MSGVEPVVRERVASELRRRDEAPLGEHGSTGDRSGQQRVHVVARLANIPLQFLGLLHVEPAAALVLEHLRAQADCGAFLQLHRAGNALPVDEGAIGRQILGHHGAVDERHPRMEPRDLLVVDDERLLQAAADGDRLGADLQSLSRRGPLEHDKIVRKGVCRGHRAEQMFPAHEHRAFAPVLVLFLWYHGSSSCGCGQRWA